jgi:hypothetical protein
MSKLKVLKENPELLNELEEQLRAMSGAVRRLLAGPLNERALLLLINDACPAKVGISDIKVVLDAVANLDSKYLKKKIKQ